MAEFPVAERDLSKVTYRNRLGESLNFDEMVKQSFTDGIVVVHQGRILYERYLNGMTTHTLHAWASGSKSVVGVLAAHFAAEGFFDPEEEVTTYPPELSASGFQGATIRQVMDMTTAVSFPDNDPDPVSESVRYAICMGWREPQGPS